MSTETQAIQELATGEYKYGFVTDVEAEAFPRGLSEDIVRELSARKGEPDWMLDWRLKAYRTWLTLKDPDWANVRHEPIDYQGIIYYSAPKRPKALARLDELDPEIRKTFEKLGIPIDEQKMMPSAFSLSLNVVATETLSNTASTATPDSAFCSSTGMPRRSNVLRISGSSSSRLARRFGRFGAE